MTKYSQLTGVDLFKFIFSFAVIEIHVSAENGIGLPRPAVIEYFVNLAVPFFFIVSGFLIARKIEDKQSSEVASMFRHRGMQLLRIFGIWLTIYLPLTIYYDLDLGMPVWKLIIIYFIDVLLTGQSYMAWPLWFIYSMSIIFLILGLIKWSKRHIVILFFLFSLVPVIVWLNYHYDFIFLKTIYIVVRRTLGGGVYILAGVMLFWFSKRHDRRFLLIVSLIASVVFFIYDLPLWELLGGIAFFNIALLLTFPSRRIFLVLRNQSMWIYFLHMYPLFAAVIISKELDRPLRLLPTYAFVCILTLAISITIGYMIHTYPKAHFLKRLIS